MSVTRLDIRTRAKRRADMENSTFVSDAEWNDYINEEIASLHDMVILTYRDYVQKSVLITLVVDKEDYELPADFYKERAVYYLEGDTRYLLDPFMANEIADYQINTYAQYLRYRIMGNSIWFAPEPNAAATIEFWYIPQAPKLTSDSDEVAYYVVSGWEEFVVLGAAIKALEKEESLEQANALLRQRERVLNRITQSAIIRQAGKPQKIQDVYSMTYPGRRRVY